MTKPDTDASDFPDHERSMLNQLRSNIAPGMACPQPAKADAHPRRIRWSVQRNLL
jgi:hypothetical protein